jgi:hypothetical protein
LSGWRALDYIALYWSFLEETAAETTTQRSTEARLLPLKGLEEERHFLYVLICHLCC